MNMPLKNAHLPSACPGVSLRSDAIQSSYARQIAESIYELRLKFFVWCIGPSRHPRAGGYDSCARPARSDVLLKYASAHGSLARLASGTFLTGLRIGFFNTL